MPSLTLTFPSMDKPIEANVVFPARAAIAKYAKYTQIIIVEYLKNALTTDTPASILLNESLFSSSVRLRLGPDAIRRYIVRSIIVDVN